MDKKQGFFSALREEMARGLSPGRARQRRSSAAAASLRGCGEALAPLMEGPDPDDGERGSSRARREGTGLGRWVRGHLHHLRLPADAGTRRNGQLRLLLGVMGAPLAPVHVCAAEPMPHLSIKDTPIETSSAQYILQQYLAASGGHHLLSSVRNAYAMGEVRMAATEFETGGRVVRNNRAAVTAQPGRFVLWQMAPEMWYIELAVGGSKVRAGCDGELVWRHTPWLGAHAAKGPVRPLRRALQGLDPLTTASMFAGARCIGERKVNNNNNHGEEEKEEDCFVLKLCADAETLRARSSEGGAAEIIRHVLLGYFSQRTGLLVRLEDSHLTRTQSGCCDAGAAAYWETTVSSRIGDYRAVDGVTVAHSGRSVVTLLRFGGGDGDGEAVSRTSSRTRLEEAWTIEEVAFDVPGLSVDCFIPPADINKSGGSSLCTTLSETTVVELPRGGGGLLLPPCHHRANNKVAALEKAGG